MPLQLNYRPKNLDEFFGNDSVKESIINLLQREDRPHTFLFNGPSGCGKTTLARIVANMLGCGELDFIEYNISNMRGIDTAREIITSCQYEPLHGDIRVIVLNECHKATNEFQNAMLEILEEPPKSVYFILCTTDPEKLLKTVRNRTTAYHLSYLKRNEITALIAWVLQSEQVAISDKLFDSLLFSVEGCPRKALVILDQIIEIKDEEKALEIIATASIDEVSIKDLCRQIIAREAGEKRWAVLKTMLRSIDQEPESVRRAILGYLTVVLLNSQGNEAKRIAGIMNEFSRNYYDSGKAGLTTSIYMSTLV